MSTPSVSVSVPLSSLIKLNFPAGLDGFIDPNQVARMPPFFECFSWVMRAFLHACLPCQNTTPMPSRNSAALFSICTVSALPVAVVKLYFWYWR